MTEHTYIFEEGAWEAQGKYFDVTGKEFDVIAESQVLHLGQKWILEGFMELVGSESQRIFNRYEIYEPSDGVSSWIAENAALGVIRGRYMVSGDTILNTYNSVDGIYSGHEMSLKVNDDKYIARGFSLKDEKKLASWEVVLERIKV